MKDYGPAEYIIKKYEGFNEKAYRDPMSGGKPTFGFGTQYYPDGSPVLSGHRVSREKAEEYLREELTVIEDDLVNLNLDLDPGMHQALLSFIHSVGWNAFFFSNIVDALERRDLKEAVSEINSWIFDEDHKAIASLIQRRSDEITLFLSCTDEFRWQSPDILLKAFRDYEASSREVQAIRQLEKSISPYLLAEFADCFGVFTRQSSYLPFDYEELYHRSR